MRARKGGQLALALGGEPAGSREARLKALELLVERADAREAHGLDVELELSARLEDRGRGAHLDGKTVFRATNPANWAFWPEEHAAHLRRGIPSD